MNDVISVSPSQVALFRLGRHHLLRREDRPDLASVASRICGAQAQVMSAAEMSLGTRAEGIVASDVGCALWEDRTLVKTWAMRGTLHLLATEDLPLYVAALGRFLKKEVDRWLNRRGLDAHSLAVMCDAVLEVLEAGPLTRKELGAGVARILGASAVEWIEHSWGGAVKCVALKGQVCFGPNRGNETTYVRTDKWTGYRAHDRGYAGDMAEDEASAELIRRYLQAYGPADRRDYGAWSGLRAGDADRAWAELKDELVPVDVEGKRLWLLARDAYVLAGAEMDLGMEPSVVRLLPNFDSYMLAHKDKGHIVHKDHYKQVYRSAGWIAPVVLVDGRAVGTWSCRRKGVRNQVELVPFQPFSSDVYSQIEKEVDYLAKFLDAECDILLA